MRRHIIPFWIKTSALIFGCMISGVIAGEVLYPTSDTKLTQYKEELIKELKVEEGLVPHMYLLGLTIIKDVLE